MPHSEVKISKKTHSLQSDYETPINRNRLLGWANEALSKLKSDRSFLRKTVKKTKLDKNATDGSCLAALRKDNFIGEEISDLKSNEVATYVSEIVTSSKTKRKIQHMAFESSITKGKQRSKALTNIEAKENGDKQYNPKSKHRVLTSCSVDQEGNHCGHETSTKQKRKKKKCNEKAVQKCSADSTSSEDPMSFWVSECKERPRKKKKLTEYCRSNKVNCHHCCKCASEEIKIQKAEVNSNEDRNVFNGSESFSDSKKVKKCKTYKDYYTGNKTESVSEKEENATSYKLSKVKKSECMFGKGNDMSDDVSKESLKEKRKEKRYYTHAVSEECISERKKLKKYKLFTEKHKFGKSSSNSEKEDKMGSDDRCESPMKRQEKEAFEGHCNIGVKRKKKKQDKMGSDDTHKSPTKRQEKEAFEGCCNLGEKRKKKKQDKGSSDESCELPTKRQEEEVFEGHCNIGGKRKKKRQDKVSSDDRCESPSTRQEEEEEEAFEGCYNFGLKRKKKKQDKVSIDDRCELPTERQEKEVFEGCNLGEKRKKKQHKHGSSCSENLVETEKHSHCHSCCKIESASKRSKQFIDKQNSYDNRIKYEKRKRNVKDNIYSESKLISEEAKEHSKSNYDDDNDSGLGNRKKGKKKKENCKIDENISKSEERHKEKLYSDGSNVNTIETSCIQENKKKKHKELEKENHYNSSNVEGSKKKGRKENVSTNDNLKTDEFMEDHALSAVASSNTAYSAEKKGKNKRQSENEGMEAVKSKKRKASKEEKKTDNEIKGTTLNEHNTQYQESNWSPELTVTLSHFQDTTKKREESARVNNIQKSVLQGKNIKQSTKISSFGLSPIFRLLATEPEFSNDTHACQTCCRCKPHSDVTHSESAESMSKNISNIVIKIEPDVTVKQEKEDVKNIEPHIVDEQILAVKRELPTELSTNKAGRSHDGVRNVEVHETSTDNITGKEEQAPAESVSGPNEYSFVKEDMLNEYGIEDYAEGFSNECGINGSYETDISTPFYNIYDDKITVREETFHLTDMRDYQNDGGNSTECTPGTNLEFVEKKCAPSMGSFNECTSVGVLGCAYHLTAAHVHRTRGAKEMNGLNLDTMSNCEPVTFNKLENKYNVMDVQNIMQNHEEASSLCWSSVNSNEQQTSQFCDTRTSTIGRVNFMHVPRG
jgi:hypothetical protein